MLPIAIVLSQYFFGITLFIISTFLILLVLVQRGRGGGLTGALGGPGGQSAFGTKAGDVFTKITVVTAAIWIFMCAMGVFWMQQKELPLEDFSNDSSVISSSGTGMGTNPSGTTPGDSAAGNATTTTPPVTDGQAPAVPAETSAADFQPPVGGSTTAPAVPADAGDAPSTPATGTETPTTGTPAGRGAETPTATDSGNSAPSTTDPPATEATPPSSGGSGN